MDSPRSEHTRWFAEEVQPHEPTLRAYLRRKFPRLTDVDDVVQETYLRLFRARIDGRLRLARGFLFTVARNIALDGFRRRRTAEQGDAATLLPDGWPAGEMATGERASRDQELELLAEAIESLPRRCREVLKLRKIFGLSHREIAAELGISERTVNVQVGKGLRRCAKYLRARGVELPVEESA